MLRTKTNVGQIPEYSRISERLAFETQMFANIRNSQIRELTQQFFAEQIAAASIFILKLEHPSLCRLSSQEQFSAGILEVTIRSWETSRAQLDTVITLHEIQTGICCVAMYTKA